MSETNNKKMVSYSDGGARGNPGPGGIGAVLLDENGEVVAKVSEYLGIVTNNQAEYSALLAILKRAKDIGAMELTCYLDSELVVKQLNGEYKVKNKDLASLFIKVHNLRNDFQKINFVHVRREANKLADQLANEAMDRGC